MRLLAACLLAAATLTCATPAPEGGCAVDLTLVDAETGRPSPGLVRVRDAGGRAFPLDGLLCRGLGLEERHPAREWHVLSGSASLRLPPGKLSFEAIRGIETETARADVELTGAGRAQVRLELRRFHHAAASGWRSANTHLHLQKISREEADRYLVEVPRADGLDALFVSHLERADADREYVSNGLAAADLADLSARSGVLIGNGEEHRHNFTGFGEGYGHVMFLDIRKLVQPVSIGPGIMKKGTDGIPLQRGIDEAKKDGATVLWCHNTFGLEDIPNWVAGRPHAQNIFDGDPATHGTYKDTFYRYLNAGLRVPFSTGTDWFIYDFSRVYAAVPSLKTPKDWLDALKDGRTYITNGPLLKCAVGQTGPGGTVNCASPSRTWAEGRAIGRVDFRALELVRNGVVVHSAPSRKEGGHFVAEFMADVEIPGPCWFALRTPPPPLKDEPAAEFPRSELGGPIFAHTSPVYVTVQGRPPFDPEATRGLLDEVKLAKEAIGKTAVFADDHERGHVLEVYAAAITVLERMLK